MTACFATGLVSIASLGAGVAGWLAPTQRFELNRRELFPIAGSVLVGFIVERDALLALSIASLVYGTYHAFAAWNPKRAACREAFFFAFFGASWFLLMTSRDYELKVLAAVLGLCAPRVATWITARAGRWVGLLILVSAVVVQLSRVPLLIAR